jgi:hypothetical protein
MPEAAFRNRGVVRRVAVSAVGDAVHGRVVRNGASEHPATTPGALLDLEHDVATTEQLPATYIRLATRCMNPGEEQSSPDIGPKTLDACKEACNLRGTCDGVDSDGVYCYLKINCEGKKYKMGGKGSGTGYRKVEATVQFPTSNRKTSVEEYASTSYMNGSGGLFYKFYDISSLSERAAGHVPENVSFNPSLVSLPPEIGKTLHPLAVFATTVRHIEEQCARLGSGTTATRKFKRVHRTSIAVLDENFNFLATAKLEGQDHRLVVLGGSLFTTWMTYSPTKEVPHAGWHLHGVELGMNGGRLQVKLVNPRLPGVRGPLTIEGPLYNRGAAANLGVLPLGQDTDHVDVVHHFAGNADDFQASVLTLREIQSQGVHRGEIHNSIHPLPIQEHGALLGLVHTHARSGLHNAVYGSEYYQQFCLIQREFPYRVKKIGKPFCLAAASSAHAGQCEVMQVVGSVIRDPKDPKILLLAYGINDCEAAVARIPLQAVLDDMT